MRVLVTGGTGMVGMQLVQDLGKEHKVAVLARAVASRGLQIAPLLGDVTDADSLRGCSAFCPDVVCHLAAISSNQIANACPSLCAQVNFLGTVNMVEECKKMGQSPVFILASSSEVYGGATGAVHELAPVRADMPYAVTKLAAEMYVKQSGLKYVIMRPFNTYGRANVGSPVSVLDKWILAGLTGGKLFLYDPEPRRDFLFRLDHAAAYVAVIKALEEDGSKVIGQTFNFGTGHSWSIGHCLNLVTDALSLPPERIEHVPFKRSGDVPVLHADSTKAQVLLGWAPKYTLKAGLEEAVREWRVRLQCPS